jgi:hypothetical protein
LIVFFFRFGSVLELGRCRFFKSVSVFGFFSVFLKVGFGFGFLEYRGFGFGFLCTLSQKGGVAWSRDPHIWGVSISQERLVRLTSNLVRRLMLAREAK